MSKFLPHWIFKALKSHNNMDNFGDKLPRVPTKPPTEFRVLNVYKNQRYTLVATNHLYNGSTRLWENYCFNVFNCKSWISWCNYTSFDNYLPYTIKSLCELACNSRGYHNENVQVLIFCDAKPQPRISWSCIAQATFLNAGSSFSIPTDISGCQTNLLLYSEQQSATASIN